MDPAERIAAYLADELDDAARGAFEDDLGRDPQLRAELAAVRRADEALAAQAPTALPDGARERLLEALRPELDARLGGDAGAGVASADDVDPGDADPGEVASGGDATVFTASASGDDLAARRERRSVPWGAIGGMAAAVVAVAVVAVGPLGLGGSGDDAGDLFATTADGAGDDAAMESAPADQAESGLAGPVLIASDRELDAATADQLLEDAGVQDLAASRLDEATASDLAAAHAAAFGADPQAVDRTFDGAADADDTAAPDAEGEVAPRAEEGPRAALRTEGDITEGLRAAVAGCLEELLAGGGAPIVVAVETVSFDREPAFAFTLVGDGPSASASRPEVWVLAQEDCSVRYFTQG